MSRLIKEVRAEYQTILAPASYTGNPLIEALPRIFTQDQVRDDVRNFPRIAFNAERSLPKHERVHCVSAVDDLVIPVPHLFEVESALSILLRRGYASRSPFSPQWKRKIFSITSEMSDPLEEYQVRSRTVPAIMVTSVSGGGKTTLIEHLLEMYPQVIVHTKYKDSPFNVKQLVWISINASFDASLRGLMLSLFGAVDSALGTNYRSQYERSKVSVDTMLGQWSQIVMTHHLGVLFVDEIQCLLLRGDHEASLALSLFLKIGNVCRLPIIFGGTYSAVQLFAKVARNARRICSGGYFDLALPGSHIDPQWDKCFVDVVWKYQWVSEPALLDDKLRAAIFELTQGIVAILIALHRAAQIYAIRNDLKTVNEAVLRKVYKSQFVPLHAALDALRSKKANRLERFEDLLPPKDQLDALLRPTASEGRAEMLEKLLALNATDIKYAVEGVSSANENTAASRQNGAAADAAEELLKRIGNNTELKDLARKAGLLNSTSSAETPPSSSSNQAERGAAPC